MSPKEFSNRYLPFAKESEAKTGINAFATLGQAAIESGWGEHAPGFMFFGVKDTDGINGNEQLVTTTEYSKKSDLKFDHFLHMEPCVINGEKFFKYTIQSYFRKYNTPEESFTDHANFFVKNERYVKAMAVKSDPDKFVDEIAKAGYATGPTYAATLKSIIHTLQQLQ